MDKKLTCEQVLALMSFYVDNKLSEPLAKQVKAHLDICSDCAESYKNFQEMLGKIVDNQNNKLQETVNANSFNTKQYNDFKQNLSAYLDNELELSENIRIKKIAISNPLARQDLESMYSFKKLLHSAFDKTKNELKDDYSKNIVSSLENNFNITKFDSFFKIAAIFVIMLFTILFGSYYILNL